MRSVPLTSLTSAVIRLKGWAGLLVVAAVLALAAATGALQPVDDALSGLRFRLLQRPVSNRLTVVEIDAASLRAAGAWPWGRDRYATAIHNLQQAGAKVVGFDVDFSARSSGPADDRLQAAVEAHPGTVVLPTFVQAASDGDEVENTPLTGLASEALLASVNVPVDPDGKVRRYAYGFDTPSGERPSMGALLAEAPLGRTGQFMLDYGIRVENVPHLSFEEVYQGRFDPALVRGRSVLIGATAVELGDEFATPRFGTLRGVYVHALGYESLLAGRDLKRLSPLAIFALACAAAFLLRPRGGALALRRALLAHAAWAGAAVAAPLALQAAAPVSLDVGLILLAQGLVLIWSVRAELNRRAQAVIEAREAHLVQLAEHMRLSRNKIRAANKKLQASNAALDKALRVRTEFLASTSHEIRTPLNGILGMTQVILADGALDPTVRHKVGVVQSAGETMLALVDDILDAAKIENGKMVISPVDMDLHRLIDDTGELWAAKAASRGVALRVTRDQAPPWICEDVTRLRQIVFNLMSNAIKFTEAGEVALSARAEGQTLVIEVTDSGIGIPAEKLEEIFEAFRQVDGSTTRKYGGTGLGLAISRQLAVAMGGDLSVSSRLGEGSVFTVRLPLRAVEARAGVGGDRPELGALLLIEANPLAQGLLKAALGPHALRLDVASSLEAATPALKARRYDLVLAEGAVLGDDSSAGLEALAAQAGEALLSVLWGGAADEVERLRRAGAAQVVRKPIRGEALVAELRALTAAHGAQPALAVAS